MPDSDDLRQICDDYKRLVGDMAEAQRKIARLEMQNQMSDALNTPTNTAVKKDELMTVEPPPKENEFKSKDPAEIIPDYVAGMMRRNAKKANQPGSEIQDLIRDRQSPNNAEDIKEIIEMSKRDDINELIQRIQKKKDYKVTSMESHIQNMQEDAVGESLNNQKKDEEKAADRDKKFAEFEKQTNEKIGSLNLRLNTAALSQLQKVLPEGYSGLVHSGASAAYLAATAMSGPVGAALAITNIAATLPERIVQIEDSLRSVFLRSIDREGGRSAIAWLDKKLASNAAYDASADAELEFAQSYSFTQGSPATKDQIDRYHNSNEWIEQGKALIKMNNEERIRRAAGNAPTNKRSRRSFDKHLDTAAEWSGGVAGFFGMIAGPVGAGVSYWVVKHAIKDGGEFLANSTGWGR